MREQAIWNLTRSEGDVGSLVQWRALLGSVGRLVMDAVTK